jgi:tetratricopeptide (TPR) repeat protein
MSVLFQKLVRTLFKSKSSEKAVQHASQANTLVEADTSAQLLEQGIDLRRKGLFSEALSVFDLALTKGDNPAEAHYQTAVTHLSLKDLNAAVDALQVAVAINPAHGEAWLLLGITLARLDHDEEAGEAFRHALEHVQGSSLYEAHLQLASSLHAMQRHEEALQHIDSAANLPAADWRCHALKGNLLMIREADALAAQSYQMAIKSCESPSVELLLQYGVARQNIGDFYEAWTLFDSVLTREPGNAMARWYFAQCELVQGRWAGGWKSYGSRFAAGASPYRPMPYPVWDGRSALDQNLLILADQGLGDEIMFASCFSEAKNLVGHCIVECDPRLAVLFRRSFPEITFLPSNREPDGSWLRGNPTPHWQIFGGDLPALFRTTEAAFGGGHAYLKADAGSVARWRLRLQKEFGSKPKVGISWRGGTIGTRTLNRSIGQNDWGPILTRTEYAFVNLQYGDSEVERKALESWHDCRIAHFPEAIEDYDETAALVTALDAVVTVCTSIVHLTGALGKPVYVLVPFSPGFRYTLGRARMPWYASSRMFRQASPGDWRAPMGSIAQNLKELTKNVN